MPRSRKPGTVATSPSHMPMLHHETAQAAIEGVVEDPSVWRSTDKNTLAFERHGVLIELHADTSDAQMLAMSSLLAADGDVAQTLLYVVSRLSTHIMRGETYVELNINEILDWKGYTRHRKGDHKPALKRAEGQRLQLLSTYVFTHTTRDKMKAGSRYLRRPMIRRSPLFSFSDGASIKEGESRRAPANKGAALAAAATKGSRVATTTENDRLQLPLLAEPDEIPYNYTIVPGGWLRRLIADGHIKYLPEALGKYSLDIPSERLALRIAFGLFFCNLKSFTIGEILALARVTVPKVHPERFEDQFYEAMSRLKADGMYEDWQCDFEQQPQKPARNWLPVWLKWRIEIIPLAAPQRD